MEIEYVKEFISKCKAAGATRFAIDVTKYENNKYYNKCIYVFNKGNELIGSFSKGEGVLYSRPKNIDMAGRTFKNLE